MKILLPINKEDFDMLSICRKNVETLKYLPKLRKGDTVVFYDKKTTSLLGSGVIEEKDWFYNCIKAVSIYHTITFSEILKNPDPDNMGWIEKIGIFSKGSYNYQAFTHILGYWTEQKFLILEGK